MIDAVKKYVGIDFDKDNCMEETKRLFSEKGLEFKEDTKWGEALYCVFEEFVENNLVNPINCL